MIVSVESVFIEKLNDTKTVGTSYGSFTIVSLAVMSVAKVAFAILGFFFLCIIFTALQEFSNGGLFGLFLFSHLLIPGVIYLILKKSDEPEATFEEAWYENF